MRASDLENRITMNYYITIKEDSKLKGQTNPLSRLLNYESQKKTRKKYLPKNF